MLPRIIAIALIFLVVVGWLFANQPSPLKLLDDLIPNLIGAAIVIVVVDITIAYRERQREKAFGEFGSARLLRSTSALMQIWKRLIIGSMAQEPLEKTDVFTDSCIEEFARHFDVRAQSDFFRSTDWGSRLNWLLNDEKDNIHKCLSVYGVFLPPTIVGSLEDLVDHPFLSLFYVFPNAKEAAASHGGPNTIFRLNEMEAKKYFAKLVALHNLLVKASPSSARRGAQTTMYDKSLAGVVGKYRLLG